MKYYTKLELRYTTHGEIDENGYEDTNYYRKVLTSKLFETEKEAINFGNKLIEKNKWIEQYPGRTNQRLEKRKSKRVPAYQAAGRHCPV
jgi:hypothetical protein